MKIAIGFISSALLLAGCSSYSIDTASMNRETPILSTSSISPLLKCVAGNVIQAHRENGAYNVASNPQGIKRLLVIIDDDQFEDGTVRKGAANDGPLADSNHAQMKAILNRWIPSYILTLPAREIPVLRRNSVKGSAITPFGTLESNAYQTLGQQYSVDNIVYFSGAFTKLDDDPHPLDKGRGTHAKLDGDTGIAFSRGKAEREAVVGLSASLGHVGTNTILSSTMIEARMHNTSSEIKFSLVPGDANIALTKKIIISEGVQGTQQMLLEAAALWFVGLAYPQEAGLAQCLTAANPEDMLKRLESWHALKHKERIALIQNLLSEADILKQGYEKGKLDDLTRQAIREYDQTYGLFHTPHIENNLDNLYLHLSSLNQSLKD